VHTATTPAGVGRFSDSRLRYVPRMAHPRYTRRRLRVFRFGLPRRQLLGGRAGFGCGRPPEALGRRLTLSRVGFDSGEAVFASERMRDSRRVFSVDAAGVDATDPGPTIEQGRTWWPWDWFPSPVLPHHALRSSQPESVRLELSNQPNRLPTSPSSSTRCAYKVVMPSDAWPAACCTSTGERPPCKA
jgi:hypothetical protein